MSIVKDPVSYNLCFNSTSMEKEKTTPPLKIFIKAEKVDEQSEINDTEMPIEPEFVEVKSETDFFLEDEDLHEEEIKQETECDEMNLKAEESDKFLVFSNGESIDDDNLDENKSQMYKCDMKPEQKGNISKNKKSFQSRHKNASDTPKYGCDICDFRTKCKTFLQRHMLKHTSPGEAQMYKCHICDFQTKYKGNIKPHLLKHKDSSQVQIFKCDTCDYESKYKRNLTYHHQLTHRDSSEVQMYRCNDCGYKTKYKYYLTQHVLKHKDSSQVQAFKCDVCDFKTKYKHGFYKHQLLHHSSLEVRVYKCGDCSFESKYKGNLRSHMLLKHNQFL